jgi:tetratricopeptide (TPR) repeat protein
MQRALALFLCLLACLLSLAACAKLGAKSSAEDVSWELTPEAQSTYHYLLLEDARRSQNATVGDYAVDQLMHADAAPRVFIEAANFYWQQGRNKDAKQVLEKGLTKYPDNQDMQLMLAQIYLVDKRFDEAAKLIENYLRKNPQDVSTRQELADILIRNEQYAKALEILEKIPSSKQNAAIRYYTAKAESGLGHKDKAQGMLRRVVQEDPKFMEAWAELAYIYEQQKDFASAEQIYSRLLKSGETSPELWLRLVDLNIKMKRPEKAMALAQKGPKDPNFALGVGTLFVDQGYYDYAEKILAPALKGKPQADELSFYLGLLAYRTKKDYAKAIQLMDSIPENHKVYDRALRFKAHLYYESGRKQEAISLAEKARKLFPGQKESWILLASLHEEEKQYDQAKKVLDEALAKWPDDMDLKYNVGMLYEKTGKRDEAMRVMEQILTKQPEHPDALNYVGYTLAEMGKDLDRALTCVQKAAKLKPDNGYIMDSLAWVYFKQKKNDLAWEHIQLAIKGTPTDPTIWEHFGDIAAAMSKKDIARQAYQKSIELKNENADKVRRKINEL